VISVNRPRSKQDALYTAIVESSRDAIIGQDLDGAIISWNRGASDLYGYGREEMLGATVACLIPPEREDVIPVLLRRAVAGERIEQTETDCVHRTKAGLEVDVASTVSSLLGEDGASLGTTIVSRDISDRKRVERRLAQLASEDDLTGLANRRRFHEELSSHLRRGARYGYRGAVLLLDLDKIKTINDTLGRGAGDQMIRRVASLLARRLRQSDMLARLGGDECAILLPQADFARSSTVAEELVEGLRASDTSKTSVGIAVIDEPVSSEEVMIRADIAMYAVKDRGGDGTALYSKLIDARFAE
jgi:diguanylate cyclase (GGDEF)-like protein/PAS domain S-box-containing protein